LYGILILKGSARVPKDHPLATPLPPGYAPDYIFKTIFEPNISIIRRLLIRGNEMRDEIRNGEIKAKDKGCAKKDKEL